MKIISQSTDQLVLKEGNASGLVVGIALVIGGALVAYYLRSANAYTVWIGLAMAVLGLGVAFFTSSITVDANRASGQMLYQKKRLIGGSDTTYAIADIFRIETRRQWQVQNSAPAGNSEATMPQPVLVAQSVIVFKDGREVPLDHQKNSSSMSAGGVVLMGGQGSEVALAAQVAKFLGVPFQEISPPNMGMGINIIG